MANVEMFLNYLDSQWEKLDKRKALFNWGSVSIDVGDDVQRVRASVQPTRDREDWLAKRERTFD